MLNIKDVEEVLSLGNAVGANKCVLVALGGWTEPAEIKAQATNLDLRIVTLEQALDLMVPDKWIICPHCKKDCIVMDRSGGIIVEGMMSLVTAGRCRECQTACVYCQACGDEILLKVKEQYRCHCKHLWKNTAKSLFVKIRGETEWDEISNTTPMLDPAQATFHLQKGKEYRERGDFPSAIEEFTKAVNNFPVAATYYQRAITYDEHGLIEQAIEDYSNVIELEPEYAMGYCSRGIAFYASGNFKEAIADLQQFLLLEPHSSSRAQIENAIAHALLNTAGQ
jgi:tetratricopeptide (TPR) repeat protein